MPQNCSSLVAYPSYFSASYSIYVIISVFSCFYFSLFFLLSIKFQLTSSFHSQKRWVKAFYVFHFHPSGLHFKLSFYLNCRFYSQTLFSLLTGKFPGAAFGPIKAVKMILTASPGRYGITPTASPATKVMLS